MAIKPSRPGKNGKPLSQPRRLRIVPPATSTAVPDPQHPCSLHVIPTLSSPLPHHHRPLLPLLLFLPPLLPCPRSLAAPALGAFPSAPRNPSPALGTDIGGGFGRVTRHAPLQGEGGALLRCACSLLTVAGLLHGTQQEVHLSSHIRTLY